MRLITHKALRRTALMLLTWAVSASPVLARIPDDPYFSEQWNLAKIRAPLAWDTSLGFEGISIAIIDSGVDLDHPDLKDNIWRNDKEIAGNGIDDDLNGYVDDIHGWDFVGNDADPQPDISGPYTVIGANHGTVDAGIAAARGDNGRGLVGVSWQATIMPLRVLDSNGSGNPQDVVRAVEYAMHSGARIINMSFAGTTYDSQLAIALRRAYDAGVFVVAAAGNAPDGGVATDLDARPLYPVCFDMGADQNFIFGVNATDADDHLTQFSNFGVGCVDMSAPGTRMLSTQFHVPGHKDFGQPYGGYYSGTSVAAAEVSGLAALIFALDRQLTPKQVMNIITETSVNIDATNRDLYGRLGRGRIDAAAAVARVIQRKREEAAPKTVQTSALLPPGASSQLVLAAPSSKRSPEVRMFTQDGTFIRSFMAYPTAFRGGLSLAVGNFDGTARKSIVTGAGPGGSPHVRIFDINTRPIGGFLAYDASFSGGITVAAGDLDGDGHDEIITGAGRGGGPHVRIFEPNGRPIGGFFAGSPSSRTGVTVSVADINGDGIAEILTRTAEGGKQTAWNPYGKVQIAASKDIGPSVLNVSAPVVASGARVLGAAHGMFPSVTLMNAIGTPIFGFQAFESSYKGGVSAVITD